MSKVALYCRVSSDTQEKNETIENQLRDLNRIYNQKDIFNIYKDNPGSGADPDRVGLRQMLADARKGLFNVVGVWASDRLARDVKLFLTIKDEFKELGIKLEVMGKERDETEMGRFMETIEAAVDELERARIKRRFSAGKARKLANNELICSSSPYGRVYIKRDRDKGIGGRFERNEAEIENINKIYKWYLELESCFLVTKKLYEEGIRARNGKFFHASTVRKILTSESNIGDYYYGKSCACEAKYHIHKVRKYKLSGRRKHPKSEWKLIKIEPIIDRDIFNRVQEIIKKRGRRDMRIRQSKYNFLCKSLVRCIHCGRIYGTKIQNKKYQLYACPQRRFSNFNDPFCKSRSISQRKLDEEVWNYVKSLIENREVVKEKINISREMRIKSIAENQTKCDLLANEKNLIKTKKDRLFELCSETEMSEATKQDFKEKLKEFEKRELSLDDQIFEIKKKMAEFEDMGLLEKEIERICSLYRGKIDNPTFELKQFIVRKWVEEINILDNGYANIKINLPFELPENVGIGGQNIPSIKNQRGKIFILCDKRKSEMLSRAFCLW